MEEGAGVAGVQRLGKSAIVLGRGAASSRWPSRVHVTVHACPALGQIARVLEGFVCSFTRYLCPVWNVAILPAFSVSTRLGFADLIQLELAPAQVAVLPAVLGGLLRDTWLFTVNSTADVSPAPFGSA